MGHPRQDAYDAWGQDRRVSEDEERFAAEMGQPSTQPRPHHFPAVLAQTPVRCNRCDKMAVPFEDVIVLVDGVWFHDECVES